MNKPRFVLNSSYSEAGGQIWIHDLAANLTRLGFVANVNDWENYGNYDVAIFTPYDAQIPKARQSNPAIKIGLVDPKTPDAAKMAQADFLIVSSLEQHDCLLKYNRNCFIFYPFPNTPRALKTHHSKSPVILGYHGNKVHLNAFYPHLTHALEALGSEIPLELWCLYNKKNLGEWKVGRPNAGKLTIKHIQWSPENMREFLPQADIGLVPALLPLKNEDAMKELSTYSKTAYLTDKNDYLVRYKYSTNPGRLYVFAQHGIPVVAGMYPSASQFITHGRSGYLAHSVEGWYVALRKLIEDADLRQSMGHALANEIDEVASPSKLAANLALYAEKIKVSEADRKPISINAVRRSEWQLRKDLVREFVESKLIPKVRRVLNH